jgi:hypothetical protein
MSKKAMPAEDGLEPLEIRHERGQQLLGLGASAYGDLIRKGLIKAVGRKRGSRTVYSSLLAYHRSRLEAPKAPPEDIREHLDAGKARKKAAASTGTAASAAESRRTKKAHAELVTE